MTLLGQHRAEGWPWSTVLFTMTSLVNDDWSSRELQKGEVNAPDWNNFVPVLRYAKIDWIQSFNCSVDFDWLTSLDLSYFIFYIF